MKAFVVYENNGQAYDDYEQWISAVYLVPDDFNYALEWDTMRQIIKRDKVVRFTKQGRIFLKDISKLNKFWVKYLDVNFNKMDFISE